MNKNVLITGTAKGLGRTLALMFAKEGYNLYLHYNLSEIAAINLQKELKSFSVNVKLIKADISKEKEVKEMFNQINDLDILINNAATCDDSNYLDKTEASFNKVITTNLTGTFLVTKYASLKIKKGNIINISSSNGIDTYYPESMDYDASKAGIISLTHNFAKALAPNIRVNCVCPGWIETKETKNMNPNFKKEEEDKILLNRFASTEEVANLVVFLASDKAEYINDSIIKIDGGVKK